MSKTEQIQSLVVLATDDRTPEQERTAAAMVVVRMIANKRIVLLETSEAEKLFEEVKEARRLVTAVREAVRMASESPVTGTVQTSPPAQGTAKAAGRWFKFKDTHFIGGWTEFVRVNIGDLAFTVPRAVISPLSDIPHSISPGSSGSLITTSRWALDNGLSMRGMFL